MAEVTEQNTEKDFAQEDVESVKSLQSKYATTTAQIGQVEIELFLLNKRLEELSSFRTELFDRYGKLQEEEKSLVSTLNEKYGDGVLDLDSGKFIPTKS